MMFRPSAPIPIYLLPMKPQMLRLAGRLADGVVLSAGLSAAFVRESLARVNDGLQAEGRAATSLPRASYILFMASEDGCTAVEGVCQKLAFLFRNRFFDDNIAHTRVPVKQEATIAAMSRRDYAAAPLLG